ncbi:hypothetical protein [Agrobacterium sp. 10MFCol1.1]|uniref:hypothetical protein n=1 Tax=Agrobacterium sp. 10MFCol1.1 TaxID=1150775 RepID=UPI001FD97043|nr:hypothetical protein [Agrobacterium sp. 10MFCol1.1]
MRIKRKSRKTEMPMEFDGLGNRHSEMRTIEIDNPHYSRVHAGSPGNPKTITAALNLRESPIAMMAAKGHLQDHQVQAAIKFRRLWEVLGGAGAGSFDYAREPVDGGGPREPITDNQIDAGFQLKSAQMVIGHRAFAIVEKVAGEGRNISELGTSHREKTTLADYLRNALEDLAEHWGYRNRQHKRRA